MKMLTVEMVMEAKPCYGYDEQRVRELLGDGLTPLEVLLLPIPAEHRIWVLTQTGCLPQEMVERVCERIHKRFTRRPASNPPDIIAQAAQSVERMQRAYDREYENEREVHLLFFKRALLKEVEQ